MADSDIGTILPPEVDEQGASSSGSHLGTRGSARSAGMMHDVIPAVIDVVALQELLRSDATTSTTGTTNTNNSTNSTSEPRKVVVLDVRWYLDGRDGRAAYEAAHLPGAVWVDLERQLAAHGAAVTEGRHPFPDPTDFAEAMGSLGIGDHTIAIAYDDTGGLTAGRLVVMLRMLGVDAAVLDGGLTAWSGEVYDGWVDPIPTVFTPRDWPSDRLASADETEALAAGTGVVMDARARERFTGAVTQIDPRPGHVPGAVNAPWSAVLDETGRLRSVEQLRAHFESLGVDDATTVVTYCGSGVSACMNILAMERAGFAPPRLYVASWSGWSADPTRPSELGE
jgi:thiosulfate/3-mercaptopyruvate sulfurtransferase